MTRLVFQLGILLSLFSCETIDERPMTPAAVPAPESAETAPPSAAAAVQPSPSPKAPEEIGSRRFYVNPKSEAAKAAARLKDTQPREAGWLQQLAAEPTAVWFTAKTTEPEAEASRLAQAVAGSTVYAVAVIQALPKQDCMRYETPGLAPAAYRTWIESLVRGLGETPIYWILEPEALLLTACLKAEALTERWNLIAETILVLKKNPRALVFVDIGYPGWLSVREAVDRLMKAGVMAADGFALNVGQYYATEDCIAYGQEISGRLGGKAFVLDTSRNGKGALSREAWCNPKNRAIGETPQAPTGIKGLEAYLWLKEPGVSDGTCNGGPAAGVWWEARAIELMRNALYPGN
ncbi:MAG TPA: glycoside hydrolase family 6 protein [Oligoflexus sp.]|uniref:glycoside hydrolase family 6 protein n=1 Tax=Oligoflexus sp. TaxID=1971216 RepID=UPI002D8007C2|nr:glycoside hydrolase family 6 protein [Oligoflexus sp.]HET9239077.1 glycoside hydrolase family 6 protein [Oligoflexus sp.]